MAKTISATYTVAQTPSFPGDNPLTIEAGGGVFLTSARAALILASGDAWSVTNDGTISNDAGGGYFGQNWAVYLGGGTFYNQGIVVGYNTAINAQPGATVVNAGTIAAVASTNREPISAPGAFVTNLAGGLITGAAFGLAAFGVQDVDNAGTISGGRLDAIYAPDGLTLDNRGLITSPAASLGGIYDKGGLLAITNEAGGTIAGQKFGVTITGGSGTIVNAGTIDGATAVGIGAGLTVSVIAEPGAVFGGKVIGDAASTLEFAAGIGAGTFSGLGSKYVGFGQVTVASGAYWTAAGTNEVAGGNFVNDGTVLALNAGLTQAGGVFVNQGSISAGANVGVTALSGAVVTNAQNGVISGGAFDGVQVHGGATLFNQGLISSGSFGGAYAYAGGVVLNMATGTLTGSQDGFSEGGGTLINAGTIAAASANGAAVFAGRAGYAGLVVVDPGAVFIGRVDSYDMIGAPVTSTLEFAAGTKAGTLAGLGSQYVDFGQISIDSAATWTVAGGNTLGAGYTLHNLGTLIDTGGITVASGGVITAAGVGATVIYGGVLNNGGEVYGGSYGIVAEIGANTVINSGGVTAGSGISVAAVSALTNTTGGTIIGTAGRGVQLYGGTLLNDALIDGAQYGVFASDNAPVTNLSQGTIGVTAANGIALSGAYGFENSGLVGGTIRAVYDFGSNVTNEAGGRIEGGATGVGGYGHVINAGTISGGAATSFAVGFSAGFANRAAVDPGAVFVGTVDGGNTIGASLTSVLEFASGTSSGTVTGLGSEYVNFALVQIDSGATWTASGVNSIVAGQSVVSEGGYLIADGSFTNAGSITGTGYGLTLGGGTIINTGTISGNFGAVDGQRYVGGTVVNGGLLSTDAGIALNVPGSNAINQNGGRVIGAGSGINFGGSAFSLVNDGYVSGGNLGVFFYGPATNLAQGTITSPNKGVEGFGTFINAGTIAGTGSSAYAVKLDTDAGNRIVVQPGARFIGTVDGGNPIGASYVSTLEFASATSIGAFSGLGSQYIDFGEITVDAGAVWDAISDNSIAAGQTLAEAGRVFNAGTFVNAGQISAAQAGLYVDSGMLTNTGTINGRLTAIETNIDGGGAKIVNSGLLTGGVGVGIENATITNQSGGTIAGNVGAEVRASALLVNSSHVVGTLGSGVILSGGVVTNAAGATISGLDYGIEGNGTIVNAGTITASNVSDALNLYGGASRVIVEPGAVFQGTLDGGNTIGGTYVSALEFGAGVGTLAGFGTTVFDFAQVTFDAGAQWLLAGSAYGFGGGETISGFAPGSTIELTGDVESKDALTGGALTLSGGTTIELPGAVGANVTNDGTNTFITACFATGTAIATARGYVAVEALTTGDLVLTATGRLAPVAWIGHRRTDLRRHPRPHDVMPVRVRAGAFAEKVPVRDLVLSPDHAVLMEGHLVPIRHLINGQSIVQETRKSVTYWHVELDRHDVLLAEDLACETYLDTGNRHAFEGEAAVALHPEFGRDHALAMWQARGCAPILMDTADATLRALHLRLLARAAVIRAA